MTQYTKLGPGGYPIAASQAADQTLLPSLVTDTDTFFAPTVTVGSVTLLPGLITDTDTFYAPTVSATYSLTPGLVTDVDVFFSAIVSPGAVALLPSLYNDTDTFFSPTISATYTLTPSLYADTDTFFTPTVSVGTVTLLPALYNDADIFYAPTISEGAVTLLPSLYDDTDTFFTPTVTPGAITLLPGLITDVDVFYVPAITQDQVLAPALFGDTDTFYSPTITTTYSVTPALHDDADIFYVPVVDGGTITLRPQQVVDASAVIYPPNVSYVILPHLFTDTDVFPTVNVARALSPSLFLDTDTIPSPVLKYNVTLFPPLVLESDILYTPAVQELKKTGGNGGGGNPHDLPSDLKYATSLTMTESGAIIALEVTANTAKTLGIRMMVYSNVSGAPSALLGTSVAKTSVVIGANDFNMLAPVSVLAGQVVWIAVQTDGNFNWLLTNSPGGSKYNNDAFADGPSNPFGAINNDNKKAPVFALFLTAANATVLPNLVTDVDTFYSPAITGRYTLVSPLHPDPDGFFTPLVHTENQLLATTVVDVEQFPTITVTSSITILPSLIDEESVIYQGIVSTGAGGVFSANIPSDDVFYSPTVTTSGAHLHSAAYPSDDQFFSPTVSINNPLAPALVTEADVIYSPTVSASNVLLPAIVVDIDNIFELDVATLLQNRTLLPSLFIDTDTFYPPETGGGKAIKRTYLEGDMGTPSLSGSLDSVTLEGEVPETVESGDWEN